MLIKKTLDLNFEAAGIGRHLEPLHENALPAQHTEIGKEGNRNPALARRLRRQRRRSRQAPIRTGGWTVSAW